MDRLWVRGAWMMRVDVHRGGCGGFSDTIGLDSVEDLFEGFVPTIIYSIIAIVLVVIVA